MIKVWYYNIFESTATTAYEYSVSHTHTHTTMTMFEEAALRQKLTWIASATKRSMSRSNHSPTLATMTHFDDDRLSGEYLQLTNIVTLS